MSGRRLLRRSPIWRHPARPSALLLEALHDPEATVRFSAVLQLGEFKQFTDRDVFERMLEVPDEDVRWGARDSLDRRFA